METREITRTRGGAFLLQETHPEYVFTPEQVKTYKSKKSKLNPCEQTPELCSKISLRVAFMSDILKEKTKQKNIKESK